MESTYSTGHVSCRNYDTGPKQLVELVRLPAGTRKSIDITDTEIVFFTGGDIYLSFGDVKDRHFPQGQFSLFPSGTRLAVHTDVGSCGIIMRIRQNIRLGENRTLERLFTDYDDITGGHSVLDIHSRIGEQLQMLAGYIGDGLKCNHFLDLQQKELLLLIGHYYPEETLAAFFRPLACADSRFMDFIRRNYRKARNVTELAKMANYSMPGFKIKFKSVFGIPPLQWLSRQKVHNVYHELVHSDKSLKEISGEYHFASVSHLSTFCAEKLAMPPGQLRKTERNGKERDNSQNHEKKHLYLKKPVENSKTKLDTFVPVK